MLFASGSSAESLNRAALPAATTPAGQTAPGAQATPPAMPAGQQRETAPAPQPQSPRRTSFDLSDYGVEIEPDARLIVMMAALDAAGFDPPPPQGRPASAFRARVRSDHANLDPALRDRLRRFFSASLQQLPPSATPAEQAARYVSLAFALGAAPAFTAPERTDDLPTGVLEVMDFAPLLREYYRQSGIAERLPEYMRAYRAEGEQLRAPTAEMLRGILSYLRVQPVTLMVERVPVRPSGQSGSSGSRSGRGQQQQPTYPVREHERRFRIIPDLLAASGAVNFRVIGDRYFAIIPSGTNPVSSELRRAYLQYLVDPLVARFNRNIAARRDDLRRLLNERAEAAGNRAAVTPDVFLAVGRSLVAAADARQTETTRLEALMRQNSRRLQEAPDAIARVEIMRETQEERARITDATVADLAEAYERGAVLAFYFAEQLKGLEESGFDITNFLADMITSFDVAKESRRPTEYAAARTRALAYAAARRAAAPLADNPGELSPEEARRLALFRQLDEINDLLRARNYAEAETRARALLAGYPGEPRIFFALGQAASISAQDALNEETQHERLNRALTQYRLATQAASLETDKALLSRAYAAMGRIHAFFGRNEEALREYENAIRLGDVTGGAYREAMDGKARLSPPR